MRSYFSLKYSQEAGRLDFKVCLWGAKFVFPLREVDWLSTRFCVQYSTGPDIPRCSDKQI